MSLIKCKECNGAVSTKAKLCPKCGAPIVKRMGCVGVVGIVLVASFVIVLVSPKVVQETKKEGPARNIPAVQDEGGVMGTLSVRETIPFNILTLQSEELPETVKLKEAYEFQIANGTGKAKAMPGAQLKVVARHGEMIEVLFLNGRNKIPFRITTLEDDVVAKRDVERKRKAEAAKKAYEEALAARNEEKEEAEGLARRKQMIEKQFSGWDGSHMGLTKVIKQGMNDPESFKHEETRYVDKGDHILVVTSFRGTNAVGGVIKDFVTAKVDLEGNVMEIIEPK